MREIRCGAADVTEGKQLTLEVRRDCDVEYLRRAESFVRWTVDDLDDTALRMSESSFKRTLGRRMTTSAEVALITGAASGIGAAVARTLAARGAQIGLLDLDEHGLTATTGFIRNARGSTASLRGHKPP